MTENRKCINCGKDLDYSEWDDVFFHKDRLDENDNGVFCDKSRTIKATIVKDDEAKRA